MGWITRRLGNGLWGTVDSDIPDSPPQVSFTGTITTNPELTQSFGRIANSQFHDNEEVRKDFTTNFEYIAVAQKDSSTSDTVWACIRVTWQGNKRVRMQFRSNISWDDRTVGW